MKRGITIIAYLSRIKTILQKQPNDGFVSTPGSPIEGSVSKGFKADIPRLDGIYFRGNIQMSQSISTR